MPRTRKAAPPPASSDEATASSSEEDDSLEGVLWQWQKEDGSWTDFAEKDKAELEHGFRKKPTGKYETKKLTFNAAKVTYMFDFKHMKQINTKTDKERPLRRLVTSHSTGYASLLKRHSMSWGAGKDRKTSKKKGAGRDSESDEDDAEDDKTRGKRKKGATSEGKTPTKRKGKDDKSAYRPLGKLPPPLSVSDIKKQAALGAQSLRNYKKDYGAAVSKDAHAKRCFDRMLGNEARLCGEWAVFYHSTSFACLLYEVQAAVAAVLFRFKSNFSSLPRLLKAPYNEIATKDELLEAFKKMPGMDHNVKFRSVAICATTTLVGPDPEAPPKNVFLAGYCCSDVSFKGVLTQLLESCYVPKDKVKKLADDIVKLSEKHGLDVSQFGGKRCKSGRAGHLLQIFMKRELVERFVYASLPFGVLDKTRDPIEKHLNGPGPISGQVRILCHPSLFMQASQVRMFVYAADETFHDNREKFQEELTALLKPILGRDDTRERAAKGIHGGELPSWYKSDDQSDKANVANKYK
eukprot:m.255633 g.255633  ORF g.255633 m.255633 type:complete len:521 (-) comp22694_c0_seq2:82-1644(-)